MATIVPAGMQAINNGIAQAALSQPPESIEKAIHSFDSILGNPQYTETRATTADQGVAPSASVASPVEYIAAGATSGEIISAEQLLAAYRTPGFHISKGVQSFLQNGIQEALASLKPKLGSKFVRPEILEPLNDLLATNQIKDLNASRLQPSMEAVADLYSTLNKMESANSQLQVNMLRMIRA
jgi:hypothetical protein